MNAAVFAQRCLHHPMREAVARCPECERFFCRECITEHDDRVICSACLKKLATRRSSSISALGWLLRPAQVAVGVLVAWLFFYAAGRVLLSIPAAYHEGSVWQAGWLSDEE